MPKLYTDSTEFRLVWYKGNTKKTTDWLNIGGNSMADLEHMAYRNEILKDSFTWVEYQ